MVVDPAGVLENVVPDVTGYVQGFLEELLQGPTLVFGVLFNDLIQVVDVVLVMLGMVDFHGPGIDMGFQCVKLIAQGCELIGIGLQ